MVVIDEVVSLGNTSLRGCWGGGLCRMNGHVHLESHREPDQQMLRAQKYTVSLISAVSSWLECRLRMGV